MGTDGGWKREIQKNVDLMSVSEKRFVTDGVGFPGG
jgi:hypothetical protein